MFKSLKFWEKDRPKRIPRGLLKTPNVKLCQPKEKKTFGQKFFGSKLANNNYDKVEVFIDRNRIFLNGDFSNNEWDFTKVIKRCVRHFKIHGWQNIRKIEIICKSITDQDLQVLSYNISHNFVKIQNLTIKMEQFRGYYNKGTTGLVYELRRHSIELRQFALVFDWYQNITNEDVSYLVKWIKSNSKTLTQLKLCFNQYVSAQNLEPIRSAIGKYCRNLQCLSLAFVNSKKRISNLKDLTHNSWHELPKLRQLELTISCGCYEEYCGGEFEKAFSPFAELRNIQKLVLEFITCCDQQDGPLFDILSSHILKLTDLKSVTIKENLNSSTKKYLRDRFRFIPNFSIIKPVQHQN